MALIVLVRHGQASWGEADYDVLSEHGRAQARTLGAGWKAAGFEPTTIASGSLRRQRETAEAVRDGLGSAAAPAVVRGFEEFDHLDVFAHVVGTDGRLPSLDGDAAARRFGQGLTDWIGGARPYQETYDQFRARVGAALADLAGGLDDDAKAVIVTSGGVIAGIVCDLLGLDAERWPELVAPIVNTSAHRILLRQGKRMLMSYNEHSHLAIRDVTYT